MAYSIKGDGEAILWLHGLALDSTLWDGFTDELPQFKHLLVDMPGFGQSGQMPAPKTIEVIAQQVKAVLDKEGIAQASVIGHSMGGYVALSLIAQYPGLVTRLCMFHSQPYADDDAKKADRKKLMAFIKKNGTEPWMKEFYPNLFAEDNRAQLALTIKLLIDKGIQLHQKAVINTIEAIMNRPDRSAVLENFKGPVLFIVGKKDEAIPATKSLAQLNLPKQSIAELLDYVAHMGIFEAPNKTKKAIKALMLLPI